MNFDTFAYCMSIHRELCKLVEKNNLSEDHYRNEQMKKDFESLFNYFDALTDGKDVKLADFVE